jgi:Fe2+ transport system protein FeoA
MRRAEERPTGACPLSDLPDDASAVVVRMDLPDETAWKFMEMGFGVGRKVRLVRRAPWGDPLEVELLGYRLAVRAEDVRGIWVKAELLRRLR